jgi:hypothetical protein
VSQHAKITLSDGSKEQSLELPVEKGLDIAALRAKTGYVALDPRS